MKLLLLRSLSWGWGLLAAVIIALALGVSVVRVVTPMANEYRNEVAAQLSRLLKRPVEIGSLRLAWEGLVPALDLEDVRIKDDPGLATVLQFLRVQVAIAPWRSFAAGRLEPFRITLAGSKVAITRTRDGRILMRGLQHLQREQVASEVNPLELLSGLQVRLTGIDVQWRDYPLGRDFEFHARQVDLLVDSNGVAFEARAALPPHLGRDLHIVFRAAGHLDNFLAWQTQFFVEGHELELAGWPLHWLEGVPGVRGGKLDARLWGDGEPERGLSVTGTVSVNDFSLGKASDAEPGLVVPEIASQVAFTGKPEAWRLDLEQLHVQTSEGSKWDSGLSAGYVHDAEGERADLAVDRFDVRSLSDAAQLFERLPLPLREKLAALRAGGDMSEIRAHAFRSAADAAWQYSISTVLNQAHWRGAGAIPGVTGVQARVRLDQNGGGVSLAGDGMEVAYPRWIAEPLHFDAFGADLTWDHQDAGFRVRADRIRLINEDVQVAGGGTIVQAAGNAPPELHLEVQVPRIDVARAKRYVPYGALDSHTADWLRDALVAGSVHDGRVSWRGPLSGAAFRSGAAEFRAQFEVAGAALHYQNGWPDLQSLDGGVRFANARLDAEVSGGRVLNSEIRGGSVVIEDLHDSLLEIDARARGPFADVLGYLRESPLGRGLEGFLNDTDARGHSELALKVGLHLHRREGLHDRVQGELDLVDAGLHLAHGAVVAESARGRLTFTERTFAAQDIEAEFRGRPVQIDVATTSDRTVQVTTRGRFTPAELLPGYPALLSRLTGGESDWRGVVSIPHTHQTPATLELTSDLRGTLLRLPEPLGKPSINAREFRLRFALGREPAAFELTYAGLLHGRGAVHFDRGFQLERAGLGLGQAPPSVPLQGISAAGHWPEVDLTEWAAWLGSMAEVFDADARTRAMPIQFDDVLVDDLRIGGQHFAGARLSLERMAQEWRVGVEAKDLAGQISLPAEWLAGKPLRVDLKRLHLSRAKPGDAADEHAGQSVEPAPSPRALPALDLSIGEFQWGDSRFERLRITTRRIDDGQHFDAFQFQSANLAAEMSGHWKELEPGQQETYLDITANGSDAGAILRDLLGSTGFGDGSGELRGWLRWPGAPHEPQLGALEGRLETKLRNGRLLEFDPGLGRLVGLLSVDYLPRRLTLNFSDVASEGFFYDVLRGSMTFRAGSGYLEDLVIKGASAELQLKGRMGLVSQDFDLRLHVRPHLFSTLPVAAGFVVGPAAGLMVYLADKLAENAGLDVNPGGGSDYAITGGWNNPSIKPLETRTSADEAPATAE